MPRVFVISLLVVSAGSLLLGSAGFSGSATSAEDPLTDAMEAMSLDMRPAGNTATSIGLVDPCVEIPPGDSVIIDIIAEGIKDRRQMVGFEFVLGYDESTLTVAAAEHPRFELLGSKAGSLITRNVTDPLPDNDEPGDSSYNFWKTGWIDDGGPAFQGEGPSVTYTPLSLSDTDKAFQPGVLTGATIFSITPNTTTLDRGIVASNSETTATLRYPWDSEVPRLGDYYAVYINDEDGAGVLMRIQIDADTLLPAAHRIVLDTGYHVTRTTSDPIYHARTLRDGWIAAGVSCTDSDFDVVPDAGDNCPASQNYSQEDAEADGIGDVCDPDDDNDAVVDELDSCPGTLVRRSP